MSLNSDVEALARALGVGAPDASSHNRPNAWWMHPVAAGVEVGTTHHVDVVDWPTAAIILLGHASGLRVDIGECPACRARGSKRGLAMWEWMTVEWHEEHFVAEREGWVTGSRERDAWPMKRPCPACTVDGKPAGRHLLAWERAILDAMPKRAEVSCVAGEWGPIGQAMEAAKLGPFKSPGDPATRTALTVLAHRLADSVHVAVFGDWCESGHEPAAFPGVPRSGFAALLAWWLAGPDVLGQHECELRSIVPAARLTFEMSNFSPANDTLGQAAPGV